MQTSRLFCWTVTNNIFSAKSSIDAAVCLISSPTCSWWLPSSSSIAGNVLSPQNQLLKKRRHTFKSHICTRWKFVTFKRLLKFLLQGGTGNFSILFVFLLPIIDLCDEIIKFCEDRHNRNCLWSATMKSPEDSKWSYYSRHVAPWRTSIPTPIAGEIHLEQHKTWTHLSCQCTM